MNDENAVNARASTRCSTCKLPVEVLAALHADRFENGMSFDALAAKYALPERLLSESGIRRHFARHVTQPQDSSISEAGGASGGDPATCGTEHGAELDAQAVLESSTKALTEMLANLVQEHRAAVGRNPREAERLLTTFMRVQTALAKSLKERDEGRARREEFRKTIPHIVQTCTGEAARSIASLMRENGKKLREGIVEVASKRLSLDEFWNRLMRYENAWPIEVATRMKAAMTEALKTEEANVQA